MWIGFTQLIRALSDAQPIALVSRLEQLTQMQVKTGDRGSQWGTGGMVTKLRQRGSLPLPVSNSDHRRAVPWQYRKNLAGEPRYPVC